MNENTAIKKLEEEKSKNYIIKFCAYAPPEFIVDNGNFHFVINSSYKNWDKNQATPLHHK